MKDFKVKFGTGRTPAGEVKENEPVGVEDNVLQVAGSTTNF